MFTELTAIAINDGMKNLRAVVVNTTVLEFGQHVSPTRKSFVQQQSSRSPERSGKTQWLAI
jgi:hypothetical protein